MSQAIVVWDDPATREEAVIRISPSELVTLQDIVVEHALRLQDKAAMLVKGRTLMNYQQRELALSTRLWDQLHELTKDL